MLDPKNFTFSEMIFTFVNATNVPSTWKQVENINRTAATLQYIRNILKKPILVNSGFRTPLVNSSVGGSKTSAHLKGLAADITCRNKNDNEKLFEVLKKYMRELLIDQVIVYKNKGMIQWIHVGLCDSGKTPRNQVLNKSV